MNIITSRAPLSANCENVAEAVDSVARELAEMIIMIETGKRHFVNGAINSEPGAFLTKPMIDAAGAAYCNVNMYVTSARLIILLPDDAHLVSILTALISCVTKQLERIESELKLPDTILLTNNLFADVRAEYTRRTESLIIPDGYVPQVMKRAFILQNTKLRGSAAFTWHVSNDIFREASNAEDVWLADRTNVYVNFTGIELNRFTSHVQLNSLSRVLKTIGAKRVISYRERYSSKRDRWIHPADAPWRETKLSSVYEGRSWSDDTSMVKIGRNAALVNSSECMNIGDEKTTYATGAEFFDALMSKDWSNGAPMEMCQMCKKRQWAYAYAIRKDTPTGRKFAIICHECVLNDAIFADLSRSLGIQEIFPRTHFADVCDDYGVPPAHVKIFETMHGRQEMKRAGNIIMFRAPVVSVRLFPALFSAMAELGDAAEFVVVR